MGQTRVQQRDLPVLLEELKGRGASSIRRRPARFDGSVEVMWAEPEAAPLKSSDFSTDVLLWIPLYVLSGIAFVLVVGVFVIIQVFGGGLG